MLLNTQWCTGWPSPQSHDPAPAVNGDTVENLLKFGLHKFGVTSESLCF